MRNQKEQSTRRQSTLWVLYLIILAGLFIAGEPQSAQAQWTNNGNNINTTNTGNAGVGTSTPGKKFEIFTSNSTDGIKLNDGTVGSLWGIDTGNSGHFMGTLTSSPFYIITNGNSRLWVTPTGNVGVGTTNPIYGKLEVKGDGTYAGGISLYQGSGTIASSFLKSNGASDFNWHITRSGSDTQGIIINPTGYVGIGTSNPGAKLQINGSGAFNTSNSAQFNLFNTTSNSGFIQQVSDTGFWQLADMSGNTKLWVNPGSNGSITMYGNTTVTGDISATGVINAKYQDVAEWVPSRQKLSAGTVVILDPEKSNQVIASIESYDTRVAGVISEQPGVLLGEGGEGKVKVATTGRVKVKVDASKGAIKIGDLLVTSDREGVAMKSEPIMVQGRRIHAPGTIIGKALEALESGVGEIQVLLSLQ